MRCFIEASDTIDSPGSENSIDQCMGVEYNGVHEKIKQTHCDVLFVSDFAMVCPELDQSVYSVHTQF